VLRLRSFYLPLLSPDGEEVVAEGVEKGGVCGEGWTPKGPH
jgi:hypothetical protein